MFLRRLITGVGGALASFGLAMYYAAPPEMQQPVDGPERAAAPTRQHASSLIRGDHHR